MIYLITVFAGLDPARYRNSVSSEAPERAFSTLDSQISDSDRFKDAMPFLVSCRHCQVQVAFAPINDREVCLLCSSSFLTTDA
jgi:DNA polymerase alpha subunit A